MTEGITGETVLRHEMGVTVGTGIGTGTETTSDGVMILARAKAARAREGVKVFCLRGTARADPRPEVCSCDPPPPAHYCFARVRDRPYDRGLALSESAVPELELGQKI